MPWVLGKSAAVMPIRSTCGEAALPGIADIPEAAVAAVMRPRLESIGTSLCWIARCRGTARRGFVPAQADPEAAFSDFGDCKAYANAGSADRAAMDAAWSKLMIVSVSTTSQNVCAIAESVALCSVSVNVAFPSATKNTL